MTSVINASILLASLIGTVLLGRSVRRHLPDDHLSGDSKDAVKLAMGLVATMTALLLSLLVSSAKGSYDTQRTEVIQMASKVAFMGRVLTAYGPEAAGVRVKFHDVAADIVHRMWPGASGAVELTPNVSAADSLYSDIQALSPQDDKQRSLKAQAVSLAADLGQVRTLMLAQMTPSIPLPLLIVVGCWLLIIFFCFSLLAPPNLTTAFAMTTAAISVAGAIFLIMELDLPFSGIIRISNAPMQSALNQLSK